MITEIHVTGDELNALNKKVGGIYMPKPQTNEEWMKSLNTEELVDYLYEWRKDGSSVERQMWLEKHKERIKMQIRGWLKEIHNG